MPIGDLLAEITGEKPAPSSTATARPSQPLKRKADGRDNVLQVPASKAPRTTANVIRPSDNPSVASSSPKLSRALPSGLQAKPVATRRPPPGSKPSARPAPLPQDPRLTTPAAKTDRPHAVRDRPALSTPAPSTATPKKGSFAEIMSRARKVQETRGPHIGGIQHKPLERVSIKKAEDGRGESGNRKAAGASGSSLRRAGSAPSPKTVRNGSGQTTAAAKKDGRQGAGSASDARARKSGDAPQAEKKIKKAALATTGYTGTARPKLAPASSVKPARPGSRAGGGGGGGGSRGAHPRPPPPRPSNRAGKSRYQDDDDADEDMDDFIEYDDEDDDVDRGRGRGPRYDYDSDGSSDMEANIDDIDDEENRSAWVALKEDQLAEKELRRLKLEKLKKKRALRS